jgi:SAM-dependent methyltransferase
MKPRGGAPSARGAFDHAGFALQAAPMAQPEYNDGHLWEASWKTAQVHTAAGDDPFIAIDRVKYRRLTQVLPARPAKTLEIGCGSARVTTWLAAEGYEAHGLDRSPAGLDAARRNLHGVGRAAPLVRADGSLSPYRTGSFDAVLSTGLLEHFRDPQPIVDEMVRVLRPGGLFYSDIVPDKFSLFRALRFPRLKAALGRPEPFERAMSKAEMEGYLRTAGLRDVEVIPMGIFPPLLPGLWRLKPVLRGYQLLSGLPLWERFDGKAWAEPLAFYYFCTGLKP